MIVAGAAVLILGLSSAETTGPQNLVIHGGFFPNGLGGMAASFILVLFAFGGTEIAAIADELAARGAMVIGTATSESGARAILAGGAS